MPLLSDHPEFGDLERFERSIRHPGLRRQVVAGMAIGAILFVAGWCYPAYMGMRRLGRGAGHWGGTDWGEAVPTPGDGGYGGWFNVLLDVSSFSGFAWSVFHLALGLLLMYCGWQVAESAGMAWRARTLWKAGRLHVGRPPDPPGAANTAPIGQYVEPLEELQVQMLTTADPARLKALVARFTALRNEALARGVPAHRLPSLPSTHP